jgi:L-idonate 5-dehydrogenase
MRALVLHAARDLRLETRDDPPAPGPGEALVRIERGGICGTDLHYYQDGGFGAVRLRQPMILGHEVSGRVSALGDGVDGLSIGDLVAVSPSRPCNHCKFCLAGLPNQCLNMRFYGSAMPWPHSQGAFCDLVVANAGNCIPADGLTAGEAAMAEPLSVCLHALGLAGELLGRRVLVTGCGPIGLLTILAARRAGAAEIVATDIAEFPLRLAASASADRTINVATDAAALSEYAADKGYFHVHIECAGVSSALASGIASVRPRGAVVQLGLGGDMTIPLQTLTTKELSLRGSFRFHEEFAVAVEMMRKRLIDVRPLITRTMRMGDALDAFALAADRKQAMKVQLDFA